MTTSSILRIIDATRANDVEMALRYAMKIVPPEEKEVAEELIREHFNPDAAKTEMEDCSVNMTMYEVMKELSKINNQVTSAQIPTNVVEIKSNISGDFKDWIIKFKTDKSYE